ncbi:hypothetical protein GE118_00795 [Mycoplasma sp. NEAQ87857]|nr:P80 family lipoprotein [Mycoplasma sp. NEAQ87857]QGZ97339.1 hypothetical protein GE118_00795 [Mycoplasma sp. NEAQ87857]
MPVELKNLGSGYPTGATKVNNDLTAKNKNSFYNLIINYAPVAANLASYNMGISFNSEEPSLNTDLTRFVPGFTKINSQTENINNASSYILPLLKSTNVLSINGPVLHYIIKVAVEHGATKATDEESTKFFEELERANNNDSDLAKVTELWGAATSEANNQFKDYVISKSIFENYKDLLEFATKIQKSFVGAYNNGNPVASEIRAFGIDGPVALFVQALYAKLGADNSKMIITPSTVDGKVSISFSSIHSPQTETYREAKIIYDAISEAAKSGGLKLLTGGQFASNDQTKHKYAFSIGSSAGYNHNFVTKGTSTIELNKSVEGYSSISKLFTIDNDFESNNSKFIVSMEKLSEEVNGKSKTYKKFKDLITSGDVLGFISRYENPIYKSTFDYSTTANQQKYFSGHQYKSASAEDDALLTKAMNLQDGIMLLFNISKASAEQKTYIDKLVAKAKESNNFGGYLYSADLDANKRDKYVSFVFANAYTGKYSSKSRKLAAGFDAEIAKLGFVSNKTELSSLLEESELLPLIAPTKWEKTDPKKVVYSQGPSIMGIHSNEKGDKATKLFVSWLFSKDKFTFKKDGDDEKTMREPQTPADFIQKEMNYIIPTRNITSLNDDFFGKNKYLEVTLKAFKDANKGENTVIYEEPGSTFSNAFRDSLQASLDGLQTTIQTSNGSNAQSFEKFVENLKQPTES